MAANPEVIIIGAGIMGASIAYHLASRGVRVQIFEQGQNISHSSTSRSGSGVRHQWSSATNILLSKYSIERLKHFKEELGADIELNLAGYLFLVREPSTWENYKRDAELQRSFGVPTQLISPDDAAKLVPGIRTDDLQGASFCDQDGYCKPLAIRNGYLNRAIELGVQVAYSTQVTGFSLSADRITTVHTSAGDYSCDTLVNAAGSWAGEVGRLAGLDIPVTPYRRHLYVLDPIPEITHDLPFTFDADTGCYLRTSDRDIWFNKINPNEQPGQNLEVDWDWLPTVLEYAAQRFPFFANAVPSRTKSWAGCYEITPDHSPILGRHPQRANYIDASGFSGHGIMHSPATGLLMAEEIIDGRAHTIDIDEFRVTRFQDNELKPELKVF